MVYYRSEVLCEEYNLVTLISNLEVGWILVWLGLLVLWCYRGFDFFLCICFVFYNVDFVLNLVLFLGYKLIVRMFSIFCLCLEIFFEKYW